MSPPQVILIGGPADMTRMMVQGCPNEITTPSFRYPTPSAWVNRTDDTSPVSYRTEKYIRAARLRSGDTVYEWVPQ